MCLIALAWRAHPRYRLVLVANRDEYHARPTLPLAQWQDTPGVYGGRDGLHGGGWLALRGQRIAAVTNVRRPPEPDGHSRGALVADFVRGDANVPEALRTLAESATRYRPFNLLTHDGEALAFSTNLPANPLGSSGRQFASHLLEPGIHGISNGALDAPWPKTEQLKSHLNAWLNAQALGSDATVDVEPLFAALADTALAPDEQLPDTGIGLERERFLSPAFITHATYGTRASTIMLIADDHSEIIERRFGPEGVFEGETRVVS